MKFLRTKWYRNYVSGPLTLPPEFYDIFVSAPRDILPNFQGPPDSKDKNGRGRDHPRYGRVTYAFARWLQPSLIVEVGTFAGGTSIGWGKAIAENGAGRLICVDNDSYAKGTYPEITRRNINAVGLDDDQFDLECGNSPEILSKLAENYRGTADICLVDGDHTYEGAKRDILAGLPLVKHGGFMLVHDVDRARIMSEATKEHPFPVYEAIMELVEEYNFDWCILKFIRKHLGVVLVS